MKILKVLIITLITTFTLTGVSQETIFSNGCSTLPSGWINEGVQNSGYYLLTDGEYVVSPEYDLSGYTSLQLISNLRSYGSGTAPECTIQISTDGGSTWTGGSISYQDIPNVYTDFTWDIGTVASSNAKFRWFKTDGTRDLRINDLILTGTFTGPVLIDPSAFTATPVSNSEIDISWNKNGDNDNVMIAWTSNGNFGIPIDGTTYNAGNTIPGGGTVIYNGNGTSFNHTILNPLTHYYYKAWSVNGSLAYSSGVTDDAITFAHEPSNHPTNLVASTNTESEIIVSWTDALSTEHYLLKGSSTGYTSVANPVDGNPENNSLLVQNVDQGIETHTFINLNSGIRCYFKIFSYNGTGNLINYKTDNIPMADAETMAGYTPTIFFSEYVEGSSYNKAIEIYNGEDQPIDLANINVKLYTNGATTPSEIWTGTGSLESKETFIIYNSSADGIIINKGQESSAVTYFNGNDALELVYNSVVIDKIGVVGESSEWSVAGITNATQDHTLVRKLSVTTGNTNWTSSSGTDENNSEWIVFGQDHFYNLGVFGTGWSGLTDVSWSVSGNWDVRVPLSTTNTLINGFVATMPNVNNEYNSPAECYNMIIESGATVNINPGKAMTVYGDISNNGSLILKSDATGTGSLIEASGVNAEVEQYIEQEKWHFISTPINDANTSLFGGLYLRFWDEPEEVWKSVLSADSTLATDMQGYEIWSDNATTGNTTITYSGYLNAGNKTISLTNTPGTPNTTDYSGFNLVGNPYPSAVNWNNDDGSGWTRTNINMTVWVWNPDAGNYGSYTKGNPAGTNSVDSILPPQQGFFIKCNNSSGGSLSVDNTARVHSAKNILKSGKATNQYLTFNVQGNNYSDEIIVNINDNASIDYDPTLDGVKLFGIQDAPQLYVVTPDNYELSVTSLPLSNNLTIPVHLEAGTNGIYVLTCDNISGFEDIPIYLEDLKEHTIINVISGFAYEFFTSPDDEAARFLIHFSNENAPGIEENNSELTGVSVYSYDKTIYINSKEKISGQIRVIDMLGITLHSEKINESAFIKINIQDKKGYYLVHLLTDKGIITGKVFIR